MTKTEFQLAACKAGVKPELYGAVLSERFSSLDGPVAGGKVAGIAWLDGWKTESRYSCMRGEFEEEFLSKEPYVVLKKDRMSNAGNGWLPRSRLAKLSDCLVLWA